MRPYENRPPYGNLQSPRNQTDRYDEQTQAFQSADWQPSSQLPMLLPPNMPVVWAPRRRVNWPIRWSIGCSIFLIVSIIALAVISSPAIYGQSTSDGNPSQSVGDVVPTVSVTQPPTLSLSSTPTPTPTYAAIPVQPPDEAGPSSVTPTPTPTQAPANPTPTPMPTRSCKVSYVVRQEWPNGATVDLTVTNTGGVAINGWTLKFTFPGNQQISSQNWNGNFSQSGVNVTITNVSYNASIPINGSAYPGFNLSWSGSNPSPTKFTLNGITCSAA